MRYLWCSCNISKRTIQEKKRRASHKTWDLRNDKILAKALRARNGTRRWQYKEIFMQIYKKNLVWLLRWWTVSCYRSFFNSPTRIMQLWVSSPNKLQQLQITGQPTVTLIPLALMFDVSTKPLYQSSITNSKMSYIYLEALKFWKESQEVKTTKTGESEKNFHRCSTKTILRKVW